MASTAVTILKYCATKTGTYTKLVDINNYPDLGATPTKLSTTSLTNAKYHTSESGLIELPDLEFECFYDKVAYEAVEALEGDTVWFHLEFGENAVGGTFEWSGTPSVYIVGAGVDEERLMSVSTSTATEITIL